MVECDCQERNPVQPRFVMQIMKFLSIPEPGKAMYYSSPLLPLLLRQSSFVQKRKGKRNLYDFLPPSPFHYRKNGWEKEEEGEEAPKGSK